MISKEWKCDVCRSPCILMLANDDGAPEACPFYHPGFKEWVINEPKAPKAPSHEEIMKEGLWWDCGDGVYGKVIAYDSRNGLMKYVIYTGFIKGKLDSTSKDWFIGRESALIPPEK